MSREVEEGVSRVGKIFFSFFYFQPSREDFFSFFIIFKIYVFLFLFECYYNYFLILFFSFLCFLFL